MPRKSEGIKLTSYDDLFSTEESRSESTMEKVQQISVDQLVPVRAHPFKVKDDEEMDRLAQLLDGYMEAQAAFMEESGLADE